VVVALPGHILVRLAVVLQIQPLRDLLLQPEAVVVALRQLDVGVVKGPEIVDQALLALAVKENVAGGFTKNGRKRLNQGCQIFYR
jgi:hypothetical protein